MTIKELIRELSRVDDDVLDYEVWITSRHQLSRDIVIHTRAQVKEVPENIDVDARRIYLKTDER